MIRILRVIMSDLYSLPLLSLPGNGRKHILTYKYPHGDSHRSGSNYADPYKFKLLLLDEFEHVFLKKGLFGLWHRDC